MSVTTVDRKPEHLYPPFRERLERAQRKAEARIKAELGIADTFAYAETLRTQARQTYLYGQGRTRPGAVITWIRNPRFHGLGVAADHMLKKLGYKVPHRVWVILREETVKEGLANPAWSNGDFGHVQASPNDKGMLADAAAWIRSGMPKVSGPALKPPPEYDVRVFANGILIPDQYGYMETGRTWVLLRPMADALRFVIGEIGTDTVDVTETDWESEVPAGQRPALEEGDGTPTGVDGLTHNLTLAFRDVNGERRGFVRLKDLEPLAKTLTWDPNTRTAKIWD